MKNKITPFLWFNNEAEQAAKFYVSIFKKSKMLDIARYTGAGPGPKGSVMLAKFQIEGQDFIALNGGPHHKITPAVSFVVNCKTQKEIDYYWKKLSKGGKEIQCGWLEDKYGVSWQIVPSVLGKLMQSKDPEQPKRVMQAVLKMIKLDIAGLKRAAANK